MRTVLRVAVFFPMEVNIMARRAFDLVLILLVAGLLISGCTNSPNGPQQSTPTIPSVSFKGPKTNSSDPNVQSVTSGVASLNAYTQQLSVFGSLSSTQQGNARTWKYSLGTLNVTLTGTVQADGSDQWAMVFNGTDTSGATYKNFTVARGTTSGDDKSGTWDIYDSTSTSPVSELSWTTSNNILSGTLKSFSSGTVGAQTVIINNPDNSGQLTLYSGTTLTFKAVWQSNGSGNWWTYAPNGAQTGTGNWI